MIFDFFSRKQRSQPSNDNDSLVMPPPPSKSPSPLSVSAPDPSPLYALIRSVPPQTFHSYSLDRLAPSPPSPTTLNVLSSFFSSLVPPPRLHCLRCHKSYFDVENSDRSCLVPHDDESAEVERASKAKGLASEYETHWACCARTVEGDGDMGPPDGWCYEGKHTTDIRRARFRADSTPNDDKLVPCSRLRCPGQLLSPSPSSAAGRAPRKRTRPVGDETEAEDPMSQTDVEKDGHSPKRRRTKTRKAIDPSSSSPPKRRVRKTHKSAAFIEDGNDSSASTPAAKPSSPKPITPSPPFTKTKTVSILESHLNNSVGSLSDLSSIKSSSPGYGTKIVQRVAYVEVTKPKRPLRVEETMIVDTDKNEKPSDEEKADKEQVNGDREATLKSLMKPRSSTRRVFKPKPSDLGRTRSSRSRTRTRPLSEVVETSVDAEKLMI